MSAIRITLEENGSLMIPEEYRQALGLHVGDEVVLRLEDRSLRIYVSEQAIKYTQELVRQYIPEGRSLSDELIAERRAEAARE